MSRFQSILSPPCPACGEPLGHGLERCPACGAESARAEEEEVLDMVIGQSSSAISIESGSRDARRLLSSLLQLERQEIGPAQALAVSRPILDRVRAWHERMAAVDPRTLGTDRRQRMHADYVALAGSMATLLDAYQRAVERGSLSEARRLLSSVSDAYYVLRELIRHYDQG